MKKIFSTLFIMMSFYSLTFAQKQGGDFEFGVHLGYNSSYVTTNSGSYNSSFISGFNAGVVGEYYFSESWGIKAKLIYDQKGWGDGFITNGSTQINNVNYKLNYVTIPLTASWHFTESKNWCLNFGPYVGLLTSAKTGGSVSNLDIKQYVNSTDAGLALGVGYKLPISDNSNLFFEYDTQVGAANVIKPTPSDNAAYTLIRGSLNIGISF